MNMSMRMEMAPRQEMNIAARIEMRLSMVASLRDELKSLLHDGEFSPENQYDVAVERVLEQSQEIYRETLRTLLRNPVVKKQMLASPLSMARPTEMRLTEKVAHVIFASAEQYGGFQIQEEDGTERECPTTRRRLVEAFTEADKLENERVAMVGLMQAAGTAGGVGLLQEHTEMQNAQTLRQAFAPYANQLLQALKMAYIAKEGEGDYILMNFFRDLVVLERLLFLESDRIQKRFSSRFSSVTARTKKEECETAMLNVIGEYTLVSVGIVAPEVFNLKHASLDAEAVEAAHKDLKAEGGIDLKKTLQHYKLKTGGQLFWHRYAVEGMHAGANTDAAVSAFITETLRQNRDALLSAVDYATLFARVQEINADPEGESDEEQGLAQLELLRQALVSHLRRPEFRNVILNLTKKDWFRHLAHFMKPKA
jgi:hypothetical protein